MSIPELKDVSKALEQAKALVASLEAYDGSQMAHLGLLKQTDSVRVALEEPYDTATRWLENMTVACALYLLIRIEALQKLPLPPADGPAPSISADELARQCGCDTSVITRSMRVLIANGIAVDVAPDEYTHNVRSLVFLPEALGAFPCVCVDFARTWGAIPDYVKNHTPEELYDIKKSPFAFAMGHEGKTYYEVVELDPAQRNLWNLTMQNMEKNFPIVGMFPFGDLKTPLAAEPDRPLLVDVGGGRGQALKAIQADIGDFAGGKVILQDLPIVIDTLDPKDLPGVELMKYDIFTPQPVKNAHCYLMRRLLHDFYNPVVLEILKNTVSAMGPESRLVICDMIVPDRVDIGGDQVLYWLDLSLLTISGKERTLPEFKGLFDEVGLELVKVHPAALGNTAMLETRLKR